MKLNKETLKRIIKEELEAIHQEGMAPYGKNPHDLPQEGTVGGYSWRARIMSGSNTASEISMDLEVTDKSGKTVVQEIPRIFKHAAATMLGKLSKEPDAAQNIISNVLKQGKGKEPQRQSKDFR